MSKHHRTAGTDFQIVEIAGTKYKLRPLTIGVYAEMESFIASRKPDPIAIASESIKSLPASQHDAVWKAAMNQAVNNRLVTASEVAAFEDSISGLAWKLWQCLKEHHPEIDSIEAATNLLMQAGEEHFERLARSVEVASGEADLGKSSGRTEEPADPQDGQCSTETSAKPTDGPLTKSTD